MYDITAIGEILVDFHCELNNNNNINMKGSLGGATCNVAIQGRLLDKKTCFVGSVGNDVMGDFLCKRLKDIGVEHYIQKSNTTTTMAIVTLDENNDRSFDFVRDPGADSMIKIDQRMKDIVNNSRILMYGSLSFSKEPAANTIFELLENTDCIKAYDPNLRPSIWKDNEMMLSMAAKGLKYADILKIGDDELLEILGHLNVDVACADREMTIDQAAQYVLDNYRAQYIFVTMGSKGCRYYTKECTGHEPSYKITPLDTTGAGDSFFGAILSQYIDNQFNDIAYSVRYACASGAITASKKGTAEAMPCDNDILKMISEGIR